ncbi:uncharacterized protein LOC132057675 [Lycium ferocissimum]|uniref:uncharacterized protein LOC132057675 n=1 Tax=Lycium ferocissimum TaxID=112874 RepID=UPI002814E9FA|nr:uncharacterized protein LOC132057675 [Lycium ferocissimum]
MTKAYDSGSWLFLTKVLRKMGFGEVLIDMVYTNISNNWYSILINGQPCGFFKSSRGVKQGDPLSPTLFILASECMSRALNALHSKERFRGFGMPKWSPYINHLAYADDTIIFSSTKEDSLRLIMDTLTSYEAVRGQKINKGKSAVFLYHNVTQEVEEKGSFYLLGEGLLLSSMYYREEGGLGFRSLQDVSKALFSKLWWNFRTKQSLWRMYMSNKYLKKDHAVTVQWKRGTYIWKKMLQCKDVGENEIWWQVKQGDSYFWLDNWTGLGALCQILPPSFNMDRTVVLIKELKSDEGWDEERLREILPGTIVEHIVHSIRPPTGTEHDKPFWKPDTKGKFSVKTAFQLIRQRGETKPMGINIQNLQLSQVINQWWDTPVNSHVKYIFQAIPSIIVWELWKRRNAIKHGGKMSKRYSPRTKGIQVNWRPPEMGWIKCNTDGATRGNPGRGSWGFCVRNENGDLIAVKAKELTNSRCTNTQAETTAILHAIRYVEEKQFQQVILETDSLLLMNCILKIWENYPYPKRRKPVGRSSCQFSSR